MTAISYRYCHFPPVIIQHAVWLYARFTLSFRDVEELQAQWGDPGCPRAGEARQASRSQAHAKADKEERIGATDNRDSKYLISLS